MTLFLFLIPTPEAGIPNPSFSSLRHLNTQTLLSLPQPCGLWLFFHSDTQALLRELPHKIRQHLVELAGLFSHHVMAGALDEGELCSGDGACDEP